MTNYTSVVAKGIQFLDKNYSGDWRSKLDLDELDLGSCSVCVLGQLFGSYDTGLNEMGLDESRYGDENAYSLGFNTSDSMAALTKAWRDALGKDNLLIEKDDVYKEADYTYAVKVLQTHLVDLDGVNTMLYVVQGGRVRDGAFVSDAIMPTIALRDDFGKGATWSVKVEEFIPKPGTFVQNAAGQSFYVHGDGQLRELKDGAKAVDISKVDRVGLKVMKTAFGHDFSDVVKF